ncbi:MAG: tRNA pseudouridine(55) synthase TruB [Candidatus Pacebacteria bacterium]|nr:tRNA pseudouridine(55) synthase TruB [Candidatus Paceibacterota bacterium]PIR63735.1 MAG: tRNA pseudouridine(55) synthase TruB [Candidatus Pacebacteria bacterium CG10_big_fil_rev_8_21_14_0_10_40_26]PIZ78521.1 MAG: tRNA pseudouridine(55) synthase TruB [Candidatus Pacebacteria bacterium CG_4_10_14_0_2_um_filter_40_20]PJA69372.1 MAG: tRNA pseudouridine(55) synthase TruB [Candidatus Pacebacteria bacterium CG_4_9_14_3_um_filter_40_12]PJC41389.1 MAG: tRNA pseudouridine(55) synthase TruB [Candidatu
MHDLDTVQSILENKGGLLAVDKPSGVSSHTLVNWARKVFGIRKVGHTGTLDPLASGLLLLLVGRKYTKQQPKYLKQDKKYLVTAQLGITTDTYDAMGRRVSEKFWTEIEDITEKAISTALNSFQGESEQTVPAFSAVKRKGKKMYDLALSGELSTADLPKRTITILDITLISVSKDSSAQEFFVTFSVSCGSGTYVRSLVHDVGQLLGCGAIVKELRRTRIGSTQITDATVCPVLPKQYIIHKK